MPDEILETSAEKKAFSNLVSAYIKKEENAKEQEERLKKNIPPLYKGSNNKPRTKSIESKSPSSAPKSARMRNGTRNLHEALFRDSEKRKSA